MIVYLGLVLSNIRYVFIQYKYAPGLCLSPLNFAPIQAKSLPGTSRPDPCHGGAGEIRRRFSLGLGHDFRFLRYLGLPSVKIWDALALSKIFAPLGGVWTPDQHDFEHNGRARCGDSWARLKAEG